MSSNALRFGGWSLCCALSVIASHGVAAEPAADDSAQSEQSDVKERFGQAVTLFKAGDFVRALPMFRAVAMASESPNAYLYVGHCSAQLHHPVAAYKAYAQALKGISSQNSEKYAATAEAARAQLAALGPSVGLLLMSAPDAPAGSSIRLDGEEVPAAAIGAPLPVGPGDHQLETSVPGLLPLQRTVRVRAGEAKPIELSFPKPAAAPSAVSNGTTTERPDRGSLQTWGFVAGGAGLVGLSVFAIAGLDAKGVHDRLQRECASGCSDAAHRDEIQHGKSVQTVANVGLFFGLAGVLAGSGLLLFGGGSDARNSTSLAVGSSGATLSYRSRF